MHVRKKFTLVKTNIDIKQTIDKRLQLSSISKRIKNVTCIFSQVHLNLTPIN